MDEKANELYRAYEADKALVQADPELTPFQRERAITVLTDRLEEAEAEAGIRWTPVFALQIEATGSGSVELTLPKDERRTA